MTSIRSLTVSVLLRVIYVMWKALLVLPWLVLVAGLGWLVWECAVTGYWEPAALVLAWGLLLNVIQRRE
jgi:hypothetical protein